MNRRQKLQETLIPAALGIFLAASILLSIQAWIWMDTGHWPAWDLYYTFQYSRWDVSHTISWQVIRIIVDFLSDMQIALIALFASLTLVHFATLGNRSHAGSGKSGE